VSVLLDRRFNIGDLHIDVFSVISCEYTVIRPFIVFLQTKMYSTEVAEP